MSNDVVKGVIDISNPVGSRPCQTMTKGTVRTFKCENCYGYHRHIPFIYHASLILI